MSYSEKLKDPRWQKLRLFILNRDEFTCQACGSTDKTLHIHHRYYVKDRQPWDYPQFALTTLCKDCHHSDLDGRSATGHALEDWELAAETLQRVESDSIGFSLAIGYFGAAAGVTEQEMYDALMWNLKHKAKHLVRSYKNR